MIVRVLPDGRLKHEYTSEELSAHKKMEGDNMPKEEKNLLDNNILLESLRINLDRVQKEVMELQKKEADIKVQIDRIIHKE